MTIESRQAKAKQIAAGIIGLFIVLICANIGVTQYLAAHFQYHRALGLPWIGRIYPPWAWLQWQFKYYDSAPSVFGIVYIVFLLLVASAVLGYVLYYGFRLRSVKRHEGIHGTAHFATEAEIRTSGLLPQTGKSGDGVYVGGWENEKEMLNYLRHSGPEHVISIAPTRSGKGVGQVIPTLLSWLGSVLISDLKGELWAMTAGWRQKAGQIVLKFDPAAENGGCGYNPLEEIRIGTPHEIADTQNLATIIVDPDGKGLVDHWAKTAHAFLTGVILHLSYQAKADGKSPTLAGVAFALSDPARPIDELYQEMIENKHVNGERHPVVAAAGRDMVNRPEQERGSVLSTAMSFLSLYRDPLVAKNTAKSDFRIADLMDHQKPVSLYLVANPDNKDRLRPLLRLVVNQVVRGLLRVHLEFEEGRQKPAHKHKMLLMLDEFPSFGKLDIFQEALAYMAGYGLKAFLIIQNIEQLYEAYGDKAGKGIIANCHVRAAYAPNLVETAKWLSEMTGTMTIIKEDISTSGHRFGAVMENVSRALHEVQRPLLTPDECMRLRAAEKDPTGKIVKPGKMLVFVAGNPPIDGTQILYFIDSVFSERAKIPPPKQSDKLQFTNSISPAFAV